jgi:hypothetical protein
MPFLQTSDDYFLQMDGISILQQDFLKKQNTNIV